MRLRYLEASCEPPNTLVAEVVVLDQKASI